MSKKWTLEEVQAHLKVNLGEDTYNESVVIAALYKKLYGSYPKIGLSGFQAEAIESIVEVLPEIEIAEAMKVLREALKSDQDYKRTWRANIAMAFKDQYSRHGKLTPTNADIHMIANEAADNFLNTLMS